MEGGNYYCSLLLKQLISVTLIINFPARSLMLVVAAVPILPIVMHDIHDGCVRKQLLGLRESHHLAPWRSHFAKNEYQRKAKEGWRRRMKKGRLLRYRLSLGFRLYGRLQVSAKSPQPNVRASNTSFCVSAVLRLT